MPNTFAYVALLAWPLVGLYLYTMRSIGQATLWCFLGAYLFLPVRTSFKIEMVPEFDKYSISAFVALFGCLLVKRRAPRILMGFGLVEVLILMYVLSPFITSMLNSDSINVGPKVLPGETLYDGLSAAAAQLIALIPFILGRNFLRSASDIFDILRALVISGLAYSLLMLFEIRFTPQLHIWTYGYFPHVWIQQFRDGGFRPVVFLGHGLIVAFFAASAAVAAAALWRTQTRLVRIWPAGVAGYLSVVLVLCKTLGAILYGALLIPLVRWASARTQIRVATFLVFVALSYPVLRSLDLIPTSFLLSTASLVDPLRESSLKTRFDNEQSLLEHADQRLLFGWGRWGRNRLYGEEFGNDLSTTDGRWIITLGTFGLFGFIAEFGLLALSVLGAASALKCEATKTGAIYLAALALIVAIGTVDLLPNGFLDTWRWLIAGALLGRAESLKSSARRNVLLNAIPGAVSPKG